MRKVYVIMGNDYHSAVFATREAADAYIADKENEREEVEYRKQWGSPRIHWRAYEFDLQAEAA